MTDEREKMEGFLADFLGEGHIDPEEMIVEDVEVDDDGILVATDVGTFRVTVTKVED